MLDKKVIRLISSVIILISLPFFISVDGEGIELSTDLKAANEEEWGYCCPEEGSICVVGCDSREDTYYVEQPESCPDYPFVYVAGGECPSEN